MGEQDLDSAEVRNIISREQAWHYRVIPVAVSGRELLFLADSSCDSEVLEAELEVLLGGRVKIDKRDPEEISGLLSLYYPRMNAGYDLQKIAFTQEGGEFLHDLIREAKVLKSSDIHLEVYKQTCRVRIRIDGMMVERYTIAREEYPAMVNKLKIMSSLDIAEKRLPQDGRIHFDNGGDRFDIRVSVLPTLHGEKVVLRLLNNNAADIDLEKLGFSGFDLANYMQGIKRPNGILLISGPTGSGKTTTLYATLKYLNRETRNILTIEDPVEYTLEGINQVQLKESIGLNFASALRTFLRQDPDVIMVGEIRDPETANMAIRAALTGHLVLSTIHTNSAWGTISRLKDMGIPGFMVANTLNTSVAQRLLRLLCPDCKRQAAFDESLYPRQFRPYYPVETHFLAVGCQKCFNTGYKGRKAVYEVIPVDPELAEVIKQDRLGIEELLAERSIRTLAQNAFELFAAGQTTIEEIYPLLFNY
ncbi:type II/IV secretion system protein [Pedobacter sp. HMF7647]|uniref:Type II/IV secretion system protein n=1 Tax=Hufsiella arboris TaxID=2695275 RepID=A0A7K1Y754_9SPHI|nr:GspE/PulE family protein [Hufsiella arboris]MXV50395.1 type II/IV secretion system protein [Hufsiella arboris]